MQRTIHIISIVTYLVIIVGATVYLSYIGYKYYSIPQEERFYSPLHDSFKPSGIIGHGLGIVGTLLIFFGVALYIAAKRYNFLNKFIRLKYLLEFHIFLCTLGPILILYHTTFKFGGIVSIAFWSMVAIVLSGVAGRFIYIRIPRTIEGRELSLNELQQMKTDLSYVLHKKFNLEGSIVASIAELTSKQNKNSKAKTIRNLKKILSNKQLPPKENSTIIRIVKDEISLSYKIERLHTMQKLFKYWHIVHLPFALIMLIIVTVHVLITLLFGYKWLF